MSDDAEGRKKLKLTIEQYLEYRKQFAVGFVRFVLEQGLDTIAPEVRGRPRESWRKTGHRLYGYDLFEATLAAEVEARRQASAQSRLSGLRSGKGQDGRQRRAARSGQDERG